MGSTPYKLNGCAPCFGSGVLLKCDCWGRSPKLLGWEGRTSHYQLYLFWTSFRSGWWFQSLLFHMIRGNHQLYQQLHKFLGGRLVQEMLAHYQFLSWNKNIGILHDAHIYHWLAKCVSKRTSWMSLPFLRLIMSIMCHKKVQFPHGLLVMKREDQIST